MPIAKKLDSSRVSMRNAEDLFTDRVEPRKVFWDAYNVVAQNPEMYLVIAYYGIGGIGKSALLKRIKKEIDEKNPSSTNYVSYSFEVNESKEDFLYNLARQMMSCCNGLSFPFFEAAMEKIRREEGQYFEKFHKNTMASLKEHTWTDFLLSAFEDFVPAGGLILKAYNKMENGIKRLVAERKNGEEAFFKRIASSDIKKLREELHVYFAMDAYEAMKKRKKPLVIFLDAYDKLYAENRVEGKDKWIYDGDEGLINIPNTLWVLAGCEKINWPEMVLQKENLHRIGELSEKDVTEYFHEVGINDDELIAHLCNVTNGVPVYMDMCANTYYEIEEKGLKPRCEDFGKDSSELARRYLDQMNKSTRCLLELIAFLPDIWKAEDVGAIAKTIYNEMFCDELATVLKHSLIEHFENGYKLQKTFRNAIRDSYNKDNREIIQDAIFEHYMNLFMQQKNSKNYGEKLDVLNAISEILENNNKKINEDDIDDLFSECLEIMQCSFRVYEIHSIINKLCKYINSFDYSDRIKVISNNVKISAILEAGNPSEALRVAESNKEYAEKNLNDDYGERYWALLVLAQTYLSLGDFSKALDLSQFCYENLINYAGEDNPVTVDFLNNYAICCESVGEYEKARELFEKVCEICKKEWGEDHPNTLNYMYNLGSCYGALGEYEKARELCEKVYKKSKKEWGEDHPNTLDVLNNLANCYNALGEYEKARELFGKIYEKSKQELGEDHPDTLRILNNYANCYKAVGEYEKARELFGKIYEKSKQKLGEDHPTTLFFLNNLANCYKAVGEYEKARELYEKAYEKSKQKLGEDHPNTLMILNDLAANYLALKENEKARELYGRAYEISKQKLGENHPDTLMFLSNLAASYQALKENEKARELIEKVYETRKRELGEDHPKTLDSLNNLASCYQNLGENEKARELLEKVYEISKRIWGEEHLKTVFFMEHLAICLNNLGENIKAQELIKKSYEIKRCKLGEDHPDTLESLRYLAE